MSTPKGITAGGHLGWATKRCAICNRRMVVGKDVIYYCPKCSKGDEGVYFCSGDHRALHGRCPYCGTELKPLI